jgi:hypothetical protein
LVKRFTTVTGGAEIKGGCVTGVGQTITAGGLVIDAGGLTVTLGELQR